MKRILTTLAFLGLTLGSSLIAQDAMNYQGYLTDNSGAPLADGDYTLSFSVYSAPTGGTRIWGPFVLGGAGSQGSKANLAGGVFNVVLGPKDDAQRELFAAFSAPNRYLGITVGTNPEISPRQQVLAAPRAMHATRADHASTATAVGNPGDTTIYVVNGNVGIAEPAPDYKLHVNGDARIDGAIGVNQGFSNVTMNVKARPGDVAAFAARDASGAMILEAKTNHSVGINQLYNSVALNVRGVSGQDWIFNAENNDGSNTLEVKKDHNVGINHTYNNVALNVRTRANHTSAFVVEDNSANRLFRVDPKGGIDLHSTDFRGGNSHPYQIFMTLYGKGQNGNTTEWQVTLDSDDTGDEDLTFFQGDHIRGWLDGGSVGSWGGWGQPSDRRLKKEIRPYKSALSTTMALKPSTYLWKEQSEGDNRSIGFIAQEVAEVLPEAVDEAAGTLGLQYGIFGVVAIGAIQELKAEKDHEISALQTENASLKERLADMEKQLTTLSASVAALQTASENPLAKN